MSPGRGTGPARAGPVPGVPSCPGQRKPSQEAAAASSSACSTSKCSMSAKLNISGSTGSGCSLLRGAGTAGRSSPAASVACCSMAPTLPTLHRFHALRSAVLADAGDHGTRFIRPALRVPARMNVVERLLRRADSSQRRVAWLAFPLAVIKKYGDDQAGNLAAMMAYYAFLSIFLILLVFVTVLGFLLRDNPDLYQRLLNSALVEFPVFRDSLRFEGLHGNWWALVIGIGLSLWGARGVATAAMTAFNTVWNVPYHQRPGFGPALARSLGLVLTLGITVVVTGTLSGVGGAGGLGIALRVGAFVLSTLINVGLFLLAFRLAVARAIRTRCMLLSAVVSPVLWQVLLPVGAPPV